MSHRPRAITALLISVAIGVAGCAGEAPAARKPPPEPLSSRAASPTPPPEITLAFAGDVHFAERTLGLLDDPETAFGPISAQLSAADVAVVNLETAITEGGTPEPKQFKFRAPGSAYQAVKAAGIDAVSLANNHALDYGHDGLADTLRYAEEAGVPAFGAGKDAAAAYAPWVTEVRGVKIAVVGLSQIRELAHRWEATEDRPGIAMAHDLAVAANAVKAARQQADVVIAYLHWGKEGSECPTERMTVLARTLAEAGATAVIGTHAHLLLGDGWLGNTYVSYGLGNFLWWWNDAYSNDTGVLRLTLRGPELVGTRFLPARISYTTGQPLPAEGEHETRISEKFATLRGCTGLADSPGQLTDSN
ncbi:MAG: CapA family protein [Micromonosporaceae bacterium]